MNRPPHVRGSGHPPLALVGHGPSDGPGPLPPRTAEGKERPGRESGGGRNAERPASPTAALGAELRERTADLQRLKAEFDNYRKRVHRDRQAVGEIAVANVLSRLLPVLDSLAEAGEQGEVTGGFRRIAEALEAELAALGLAPVGAAGAPFDPRIHEAVTYTRDEKLDRALCTEVLRQGYRVGDQLLRPAQVAVTGPPAGRPAATTGGGNRPAPHGHCN
ncbi:nucleotide exchange factor GrpE [Streptomyces kronopolitis]|uniref:nucleotide exchange factor GrpE n=1 Tax=Streptomyces kronopolitis TaxID=1612435 RepID=UPI003682DF28